MDIRKIIEEGMKRRAEALKTNPRYDIDVLADDDGMVKLYFHSSIHLHNYLHCMGDFIWKASTERFFDTDIVYFLHKDYIEKLTDGLTIAHLRPYDID